MGVVLQRQRKEFVQYELESMSYSRVKDEGRLLGISFQKRVPNHRKLLRLRAAVVSFGGKVRAWTRAGEHPRDERK